MSMPRRETVPCPKCGKDIEFTLWQSINNEIPTAMEDVISGKLFEVECKHCGLKTNVNYPILVNDMEHSVMIYYINPDDKEETVKALNSINMFKMSRMRIVTDQASLREKVAIFHAELDDRVIELLKAVVILQVKDQLAGKEVQRVYYIHDDKPRLEVVFCDGSAPGYIPVSMDLYNLVKEEYTKRGAFAKDDEMYIDNTWAFSVITG